MRLYFDPVSTTSRIVTFFLHDNDVPFSGTIVSTYDNEQHLPSFKALNPNSQVPVIVEDDGFTLTESSAILRYLADKFGLDAYPKEVVLRAQVDEAVSWFQTNFHVYHCVMGGYTYAIPFLATLDPQVLGAIRAIGSHGSAKYLKVLDEVMLADRTFVCGDCITLADYVGAANVTLGRYAGMDLSHYPNVGRWLNRLRARKGWAPAYAIWEAELGAMQAAQQQLKSA